MVNMVASFGEILLRFAPKMQWPAVADMDCYLGGAELNVASALAAWQQPVKYITAVPQNYLANTIIKHLEQKNIDCSSLNFQGERIGAYFLPVGSELKNAGVIYDRAHSAFANIKTNQIDWKLALKDCKWFHLSAITPALSQQLADVCEEALAVAQEMGIITSIDLNYRAKLWQYGKKPSEVMPKLLQFCNVVMGNLWAAEALLDIPTGLNNENKNQEQDLLFQFGKQSMAAIAERFPSVGHMAYTYRMEKDYSALYKFGAQDLNSKRFDLPPAKDKVGSGDCFMAGLILGIMNNHHPQQIIDFAAAAAVGKLQEVGDSTAQNISQINQRINAQ